MLLRIINIIFIKMSDFAPVESLSQEDEKLNSSGIKEITPGKVHLYSLNNKFVSSVLTSTNNHEHLSVVVYYYRGEIHADTRISMHRRDIRISIIYKTGSVLYSKYMDCNDNFVIPKDSQYIGMIVDFIVLTPPVAVNHIM